MPRIRPYTQQTTAQGVIPGGARGREFGTGVADAVADFGRTLTVIGEHVDRVRQQTVLAGATAEATQELQDFAFTLQNGSVEPDGTVVAPPDPAEHLNLYEQKAKEIRERVKAQLRDDAIYGLFEQDFGKIVLRESFSVRKNMIAKQKAVALGEFEETEDVLADVAARGDAFSQASAVEQYRLRLRTMVQAGVIGAEDAPIREKKFLNMIERASVREGIRTNPEATVQALLSDGFPRLDPDERETWIRTAQNEVEQRLKARVAEENRARQEQERAQREREETTFKAAIDLSVGGKLTTAWVQANRDNISKADYDALLKMAAGGGRLTPDSRQNRETYGELRDRVSRGEDVRPLARQALARGQITEGQLNTIYNEWETRGADGTGAYKDGTNFIRNALEPSMTNPKLTGFTRARALSDFQEWARENANAPRDAVLAKAREIAQSYHVVAVQDAVIGKPRPKFVTGVLSPSDVEGSKASLVEAKRKLDEETAAGRVTPFERRYQLRIMNEWAQALRAQEELNAKNAAAAKPKGK